MNTTELIEWFLRWLILFIACVSIVAVIGSFKECKKFSTKLFLTAFFLTDLTILVHAAGMLIIYTNHKHIVCKEVIVPAVPTIDLSFVSWRKS